MALIDLTPPLLEPLDLAYVKSFLRVDSGDEDALLITLIKGARHQVENILGRALIHRKFVYRGPLPLGRQISLPMPPLVNVSAVRLYDDNENSAILEANIYAVQIREEPGSLCLKGRENWAKFLTNATRIEIEFTAGYGAGPDDVPLPIRQAIMLLVTQYFERRGLEDNIALPAMVDGLLAPYRWVRI